MTASWTARVSPVRMAIGICDEFWVSAMGLAPDRLIEMPIARLPDTASWHSLLDDPQPLH